MDPGKFVLLPPPPTEFVRAKLGLPPQMDVGPYAYVGMDCHGQLESISKPRLSTGSELFIFNRFTRCHYLVWWVRVTVSLGVKVRVSVEVRVRVSNLLGSG